MEYKSKKPLHRPAEVADVKEIVNRANDFSDLLELLTTELARLGWDAEQLHRVAAAASRLAKAAEAEALVRHSQSIAWERVQASLNRLKSSRATTLDYLEVKGWREWGVPQGLAGSQLEGLANSLAGLDEALESYEALRGTTPATRTERHALAQRLQEKEQEIAQLVEAVASVLAPAPVLDEAVPEPEPGQTSSTAAAPPRTTPTPPPAAPALTPLTPPQGPALAVAVTELQDGTTLAVGMTPAESRITEQDEDLELFIGLLEQEDLAAAFWLAHVREQAEAPGLPPSWLLQAAHLAARVIRHDADIAQAWYDVAQAHPSGWQDAR